jgi:hypothetical protein
MEKPDPRELLRQFAATISKGPLGVIDHAPEPWALLTNCIGNVLEKLQRDGGSPVYGWVFLQRISPEYGPYLIAQYHAVWKAVDSTAPLDITPFHEDEKHRPYAPGGKVLFLVDDAAPPKTLGNAVGPHPSRYFPMNDDPKLAAYTEQRAAEEKIKTQTIFEGALATQSASRRPN